MFHDEITLQLQSGKGGDGCVAFRREKYIPKGGPDGGDGGNGGDVYLVADKSLSDLSHLASLRELKAENGVAGGGRKLYGRNGEDLIVRLPVGTQVYRETRAGWRLVADLLDTERPIKVLEGGKGGLGNVHFATSTNQTPRHAQPGEPGRRATYKFELQLIADVGIIGKPNVGKSTFLSVISDAKPKIGDYPFTTLSPVLGVVPHYDARIIVADIPGLIEGASQGKGLGHVFLRHVRRTQVLLHFIDVLSDDYVRDYQTIRAELEKYDPGLAAKHEIVVLTKGELVHESMEDDIATKLAALEAVILPPSQLFSGKIISSLSRKNIDQLLGEVVAVLNVVKDAPAGLAAD